jgi:DNA-directed RNA polymerase subunit RPC12/RpoP
MTSGRWRRRSERPLGEWRGTVLEVAEKCSRCHRPIPAGGVAKIGRDDKIFCPSCAAYRR